MSDLVPAPPDASALAAARLLLAPWSYLTDPHFSGLGHVPDRPALYVGNHTVMGLLDVPLMVLGLHARRGVVLRPLGDHLHFYVPGWRDLLQLFGTVDGTRQACRALMGAGESILVFPGGGREVFKRKGEKYRLLWEGRTGFVRLAIEYGYPIVPFSAVGAEECYDILLDAGDVLRLLPPPLRRLPRIDEMPPLVRGIGLTALPRPQRFYFHFGVPLETAHLAGRASDERIYVALREQVRTEVERGIGLLLETRERDPERRLVPRLWAQLRAAVVPREDGASRPGGAAHERGGRRPRQRRGLAPSA